MKKTKLMRAALLLLVLTLITSCFVGGTFAKSPACIYCPKKKATQPSKRQRSKQPKRHPRSQPKFPRTSFSRRNGCT